MMEEEENCTLIEVTEDEVENSIQHINNLDSLILVKVYFKKNPIFFSFFNFSAAQENVFLKNVKKIMNYEKNAPVSLFINLVMIDFLLFISKNHIYLI